MKSKDELLIGICYRIPEPTHREAADIVEKLRKLFLDSNWPRKISENSCLVMIESFAAVHDIDGKSIVYVSVCMDNIPVQSENLRPEENI